MRITQRDRKTIDAIIDREGGYVNHPADKGGPTNFGITKKTLAEYRGHGVTAHQVRMMQRAEAFAIYFKNYITKPKFNEIGDDDIFDLVVDFGVNSGPDDGAKALQFAVNSVMDGVIGPKTLKAYQIKIAAGRKAEIMAMINHWRMLHIAKWVENDPSQIVFLEGVINRASWAYTEKVRGA